MQASFYHVKLNVADPEFYKKLLVYLGFDLYMDYANGFGANDGGVGFWVFKTKRGHEKNLNFEDSGLNHLAFKVASKNEVDDFYKKYLLKNKIEVLHSPAEHHQYNQGKGYYAVFFCDPEGLKLEVAWVAE